MLFRSRQLVRELDITGGDDAAVGYYAGLIVCIEITYPRELLTKRCIMIAGVSVLCHAGVDSAGVESVV
jgi:hypothetical protein